MSSVKAIPAGYHSVQPYLHVHGAAQAIEFYKQVLGAIEVMRMPQPDGRLGSFGLHPHLAERGREPWVPRQRHPTDRHEVGRPDQHHPLDGVRARGDRPERAAGDRP